ncbi:MAG: DUF2808 domain-containing protein [Cyanobacteriota bacterium]|nr:DUF2808 domain-containing protein [Cyanobacteriota bacterium]|tara:strand:+ start:448 stop:996 length:549 start_codon:yes stop_codon:yes gene_type:complete
MHSVRHLLALSAVSAAALISTPVVAQYQSTTPIFQFRMDQSAPFKRLYFFGTSGERLDRSEYYLVIKKEERLNSTDQLQVSIPRGFYKRFKLGILNVCTMQRGGFVKKTKCKDSIAFNSTFDDSNQLLTINLGETLDDDQDIAIYAKLNNPISNGLYQFNVMSSIDEQETKSYLGSWLISVN